MSFREKMRNFRADIYERFANFESIYGWALLIPFGLLLVYCGEYDLRMGYEYALKGAGVCIVVRGIRNGTVNRVKYWNKIEKLQAERKDRASDN